MRQRAQGVLARRKGRHERVALNARRRAREDQGRRVCRARRRCLGRAEQQRQHGSGEEKRPLAVRAGTISAAHPSPAVQGQRVEDSRADIQRGHEVVL